MKTYRPYSPGQSYLFPPSPHDWLPKDHLAYFVLDVVTELDLSEIFAPYEREERGFTEAVPSRRDGVAAPDRAETTGGAAAPATPRGR